MITAGQVINWLRRAGIDAKPDVRLCMRRGCNRPVIEHPSDEFYVCFPCYMESKFGKDWETQ